MHREAPQGQSKVGHRGGKATNGIAMAKKKTVSETKYDRERLAHLDIDRAARWQAVNGMCPVCQTRPTGHGITCGRIECIGAWLNIKVENVAPEQASEEEQDG